MSRLYFLLLLLCSIGIFGFATISVTAQAQYETFALATSHGQYLSAYDGGGNITNIVRTDATSIGARETFTLVPLGVAEFAFRTANRHYLTAVDGGGRTADAIHTDAKAIGAWEKFTLIPQGDGVYALQASNGRYLTALDGGGRVIDAIHTDASTIGTWERFTLILTPQGSFSGLHPWTGLAKPGFTSIDPLMIARLNRLRDSIRKWAITCNGSVFGEQSDWPYVCPSTPDERVCSNVINTTGDATLYNGLMCLSGEERFCGAVMRAQGADGRWWRSPDYVNLQCNQLKVSFSRDMAIGVLAYLAKDHDINAAKSWQLYIEQNNGLLCPDDPTLIHDYCGFTEYLPYFPWSGSSEYFGLFKDVWEGIGLDPKSLIEKAWPLLPIFSTTDADTARKNHACAIGVDPTWQVYKLAGQYLIKQFLNKETAVDREGVECLRRLMPNSPYLSFLAEGASTQTAMLTMNACSSGMDDQGNPLPWSDPDHRYQWMVDNAVNQWSESSGWDCILMTNLLTGPEPKLNLITQLKPIADPGHFQIAIDGSPFGDPIGGYSNLITTSAGLHKVALQPAGGTVGNDYIMEIGGQCAQDGFVTLYPAEEKQCVVVIRNRKAPAALTIKMKLNPPSDPGQFDINIDGIVRLAAASNGKSIGPMTLSLGDHSVTLSASPGTDISKYETAQCFGDGRIKLLPGDDITCTIIITRVKESQPNELCATGCLEELQSCLETVRTPGEQTQRACLTAYRVCSTACRLGK